MSPGRSASQAKPRPSAKTTARKTRMRIIWSSRLHGIGDQRVDLRFDIEPRLDVRGKIRAGSLHRVGQRIIFGKRLGVVALTDRRLHPGDGFGHAGPRYSTNRTHL